MNNLLKYITFTLFPVLIVLASGCSEEASEAPIIFSVTAEPGMIAPGEISTVTVKAGDSDSDELTYEWRSTDGTIDGSGEVVTWRSPEGEGKYDLTVTVSDGVHSISDAVLIRVSKDYYPLAVGNIWTYKDTEDNSVTFEIVDTIDIEALGVTTFVKQVTTSDLSEAANFSYIARSEDGIVQYGMGGSNAGGDTVTFSPELPLYRFPPVVRESWDAEFDVRLEYTYYVGSGIAEYQVESVDDLTVEAGTFQNVFKIKEDFIWELEGEQIDRILTYNWLAADVGIVKFRQEETISGQTIITEAELQSYSVSPSDF